ncbi:MAG TPA: hypothetical protein VMW41_06355 [Candidatus Bathyarchaeia archaeon]|nr:hypothetical protein [Candidatus Bathyarchaeia archaeon]
MSKLHELLAVEGDLEGTYRKIIEETTTTFSKKPDHFFGFIRTLEWFTEGMPDHPEEHKAMDTTVSDKLAYQEKHLIRYLDAVMQKESTNQKAVADLIVDGKTIAEKVPATFLLGLESKLKYIRSSYQAIPTLPPGIEWTPDDQKGENIFKRVHPEEQYKTKTEIVPQILYEATKEHPAQVEKISETKNVGLFSRHVWSGMLTPAKKSYILGRIDILIRATKKARQRANATEVEKCHIGKVLFDFING